jgi:hypothetical protein
MDHLAVARRGAGADAAFGLEHQHLAPAERQRARHGQADHAGTHHHRIDPIHALRL